MKIKVKFGLIAPLFLASILFSEQKIHLLLAVLAAALHECGHIFAAKLKKINLSSLSLDILGARLNTETGLCSYSDEIILCIFGPLMNFIVSAVSFSVFFLFFENEYIMFFGVSSMALGILNLLPIKSFDGGRILFCIISKFFGEYVSEKAIGVLSFLCCFVLWCFSVYLLIRAGISLSLFVFSVSLFSRIFIPL